MDAARKYEQYKKKDDENRTRIDRIVSIYVLDFGLELVNMVIQGFTQVRGSKIFPINRLGTTLIFSYDI